MRRSLLPAVPLAAALVLCAAPGANAYVLFGGVPKLHTYTYSSSATAYKAEVKAAARAWNRSGARVRWAQSRHPRVRIKVSSAIPSAGLATFTYGGRSGFRGLIQLQPGLKKNQASAVHGRALATAIIVHEMGHIMGLNHEDRRCAVMNSLLWQMCKRETEAWRYHCRPFERDDVRGLLRRFGGHARHLGPLFCDAEAQPAAPTGLTVMSGPAGAQITFKTPSGSVKIARVLRRRDTCPTGVEDQAADFVGIEDVKAGETNTLTDNSLYSAGHYCYAAFAVGKLGRPGKIATAQFDYAGGGPTGPTGPTAWFDAAETGARQFAFSGQGSDPNGSIVSWQWDFGDGTEPVSGQQVSHTYGADNDYTVTLTVTDNEGNTGTYTDTVYAYAPSG
jgi:chitodextrinase